MDQAKELSFMWAVRCVTGKIRLREKIWELAIAANRTIDGGAFADD